MNPKSIERRRKFRRTHDQEAEIALTELHHPNPALRPVRRVYVAVLFVLICVAIGLGYHYLQNHFNQETKRIELQRWQSAYDTCKDSNKRNHDAYAVILRIANGQKKGATKAQLQEIQTQLSEYKFLFQALSPYTPNCREHATQVTNVQP